MNMHDPIPYRLARAIVLGEGVAPIIEGHPIALRLCYPIAPQEDVFLLGRGNDPVDEETRFAGLVREVWPPLPPDDRKAMVTFWRGEGRHCHHLEIEWAPQIELQDDWFTRGAGNPASTLGGAVFVFHRRTVIGGSPEYVRTLVAHELAHALQRATGVWGKQRPIPAMSEREREEFLMRKMGFATPEALRRELMLRGRTATQVVEYILSDDEARTDDILRRWGYDPRVLDPDRPAFGENDDQPPGSGEPR